MEDERKAFRSILGRNGDLSPAVFCECFEIVKRTKDAQGNSIAKVFVWMAGGFDKILNQANASLREKQRKEEIARKAESSFGPSPEPSVDLPQEITSPDLDQPSAVEQAALKNAKNSAQSQLDSLSQQIGQAECRYSVNLDEDDFRKMQVLRKRREEIYLTNAELLDLSLSELWEEETTRLSGLMQSISLLYADVPRLAERGIERLAAVRSEILSKTQSLTEERAKIRKQIHESLGGAKWGSPVRLVAAG